jgi:hypothetical protein
VGSGKADKYGFFKRNNDERYNIANPNPEKLTKGGFGKFSFKNDLVLGGRADAQSSRFFRGRLALVTVFDFALNDAQAACLFRSGDAALPDPKAHEGAKCQHNGTATRAFGHYICQCVGGYSGPTCARAPAPKGSCYPLPTIQGALGWASRGSPGPTPDIIKDGDTVDLVCPKGATMQPAKAYIKCQEGTLFGDGLKAKCTPAPPPAPPAPPAPKGGYRYVDPIVEAMSASVDMNHVTYTLKAKLKGGAANCYTITGTQKGAMIIPPAYQDVKFGKSMGGVSAAMVKALTSVAPGLAFDSWLTVGITGGDKSNELGSAGLSTLFKVWNEKQGINTRDGAVFWMNPNNARAKDTFVVAQLTVAKGFKGTAQFGMVGKTVSGGWSEDAVVFNMG